METQIPGPLAALMPLLLLGVFWGIFLMFIAKRKGVNIALAILLALLPIVNVFWGIYLISLTDISIKRRLEKLEDKTYILKVKNE